MACLRVRNLVLQQLAQDTHQNKLSIVVPLWTRPSDLPIRWMELRLPGMISAQHTHTGAIKVVWLSLQPRKDYTAMLEWHLHTT